MHGETIIYTTDNVSWSFEITCQNYMVVYIYCVTNHMVHMIKLEVHTPRLIPGFDYV